MRTFNQYFDLFIDWGDTRGIYTDSTAEKQLQKFSEELGEYFTADTYIKQMDAIGDMIVCLSHVWKFYASTSLTVKRPQVDMSMGAGIGVHNALRNVALGFKGKDCTDIGTAISCLLQIYGVAPLELVWEGSTEITGLKDRDGYMIKGLFVKFSSLAPDQKAAYLLQKQDSKTKETADAFSLSP